MKFSWSMTGLLYITVVGGLCYLMPIPALFKAFLALPSLLIIPYLAGKTIFLPLRKFLKVEFNFDVVSRFIIIWCVGIIFIVTIAYFLNYFYLFNAKIFTILVFFLMILSVFYKEEGGYIKDFVNAYGGKSPIILAIFIGILMPIFITNFSPYPYTNGGDFIGHNYYTQLIFKENIVYFAWAYIFTMHILYSLPSLLFNIYGDSYALFWASRFLFHVIYAFGLYIFSYEISKNIKLSLLASFVGSFVLLNYICGAFMFFYEIAPKQVIFILFLFFMFFIYKNILNREFISNFKIKDFAFITSSLVVFSIALTALLLSTTLKIGETIGIIIPLFLISILLFVKFILKDMYHRVYFISISLFMTTLLFWHIFNGAFAFMFLMFAIVAFYALERYNLIARILIYVTIVILMTLYFLLKTGIIIFDKPLLTLHGEIATHWGITPISNYIAHTYPLTVLSLFMIGFVFLVFKSKNSNKKLSLLFVFSVASIALLLPFPMALRMLMYTHPILIYISMYAAISFYNLFSLKTKRPYFREVVIAFVIVILVLSIIPKNMEEMEPSISKRGCFTCYFLTPYFFQLSEFIKYNTPENTIVLGANHLGNGYVSRDLPEYAYKKEVTNTFPYTVIKSSGLTPQQKYMYDAFLTQDPEKAYQKIYKMIHNESFTCRRYRYKLIDPDRCRQEGIENLTAIIIISKDLKKWLKSNYKNAYSEDILMDKFYNTYYFTQIYNDSKHNIYIFALNPRPGVSFNLSNSSRY